jgi:hypothetical protein
MTYSASFLKMLCFAGRGLQDCQVKCKDFAQNSWPRRGVTSLYNLLVLASCIAFRVYCLFMVEDLLLFICSTKIVD